MPVEGQVWRGEEAIRGLLVPLDRVTIDPANARQHPARNVADIAGSLAAFGQQTPIVVDADGVCRKGNGTTLAARQLGWTHLAAVPSSLSGVDAARYSLADNRTGETSLWDFEAVVTTLKAIQEAGGQIGDLGWADYELEPLLQAEWSPPAVSGEAFDQPPPKDHGEHGHAVRLTPEQWAVFRAACEAIRSDSPPDLADAEFSDGELLEAICRAYLDSAATDDA